MAYKFVGYLLLLLEYLTGLQALPFGEIFGFVPVLRGTFSMDNFTTNGGGLKSPGAPLERCRHGQAALLLAESLMHALVEKGLLSREEFIEIAEGAAEVELELTSENALSPCDSNGSLLNPLAVAYRQELSK